MNKPEARPSRVSQDKLFGGALMVGALFSAMGGLEGIVHPDPHQIVPTSFDAGLTLGLIVGGIAFLAKRTVNKV